MAELSNNKKLGIVGAATATLTAVIVAAIALLGNGGNPAQFLGQPGTPQPFSTHSDYQNYDVQVHSRDVQTWDSLETMQAEHGGDCSGPPVTHENHTYEGAVFICKDHLMTAIKAGGYGVIYLTPNQMVDFSQGPATIDWAMSTQVDSLRDWPDWWISPWADNIALPFTDGSTDLQTEAINNIHITFQTSQYSPILTSMVNNVENWWNQADVTPPLRTGITVGTNEAAVRQHFRITISRTHVKFERLASSTATALTYIDTDISSLGFAQGVLQIGHHSYNPEKDGAGIAGTWHWEAPLINPAVAFSIGHADERFTTGGTIHFAPAPANAFLRFAAVGLVTVNGVPLAPKIPTIHQEHFNSYWVPIAQGATIATIGLSADGWYTGPFRAQDFAVWSSNSGPVSTPTPAVSTATPTATVVSATPVSTATPTLVPSTPTPPATSTPAPTATPTIVPVGPLKDCTGRWGNTSVVDLGKLSQAQCIAITSQ